MKDKLVTTIINKITLDSKYKWNNIYYNICINFKWLNKYTI